MPGFHLMKESLAVRTANLNRHAGKRYPFPTTTGNAVASGMMDAVCGSVMMMHGRLKEKTGAGKPVDVIITAAARQKLPKPCRLHFWRKIPCAWRTTSSFTGC